MPEPRRCSLRCLLIAAGVTCAGIAYAAAPVANDDAYSTGYNDTLVVSAPGVLANDTDGDNDPLSASATSTPMNGTLTLNPNGAFTYNPDNTFYGTDSFSYQVTDGSEVATAVVQITVEAYGGGGGGGGGGYGSGGAPSSALLMLFAAAALYRGLKPSKRRAISP